MWCRKCCCGKTSAQVKCSSKTILTCRNVCDKLLNCGAHNCTKLCHGGPCDPCAFIIELGMYTTLSRHYLFTFTYYLLVLLNLAWVFFNSSVIAKDAPVHVILYVYTCIIYITTACHCKSENKSTLCDSSTSRVVAFSCGRPCDKLLSCQNHKCSDNCHVGACDPCSLSPEIVLRCPCGQTSVTEACRKCNIPPRKRCLDPIPVCGKVCGKSLPCGGSGVPHKCSALCHANPTCPTCPLLTNFKCRCGSKTFELSCAQYDPEKEYRCEKRCTKVCWCI